MDTDELLGILFLIFLIAGIIYTIRILTKTPTRSAVSAFLIIACTITYYVVDDIRSSANGRLDILEIGTTVCVRLYPIDVSKPSYGCYDSSVINTKP